MRTAATGFFLGYLAVGLLIAPVVLCALQVTPNYASGVAMVLDREGVSATVDRTAQQLVELRDRMNQKLAVEVDRLIFPRPRN